MFSNANRLRDMSLDGSGGQPRSDGGGGSGAFPREFLHDMQATV